MDLEQVAPELRKPLRRLPASDVSRGWVRGLTRAALQLARPVHTPGVRVQAVREGAATLRLHLPDERRGDGALLWIHGGGYVIGRAVQDDALCGATAKALGVPVAAASYRLAPEHPFPAPLDDCRAAWDWLQSRAGALAVDPRRVAIGGQSAGGGLAAALVQQVHDAPGPGAFAQWLFCPMLDDRTAARADIDPAGHFVWTNRSNAYGWRAYLGQPSAGGNLPDYAAPARRADLGGLPPAWIAVGDIDLFLDEDRAYAQRLRAAGVETTFLTVPGAPHGFEAWAPGSEAARRLLAEGRAWLAERLATR